VDYKSTMAIRHQPSVHSIAAGLKLAFFHKSVPSETQTGLPSSPTSGHF